MTPIVCIDGTLAAAADAAVPALDRGLLLGDGCFEVLRTYGGALLGLEEHLDRLASSCTSLGIALPLDRAALAAEVRDTVRAARFDESYVRVVVTRGVGELGLDPEGAGPALRLVIVAPLRPPDLSLWERGLAVALVTGARATDGPGLAGLKPTSYAASISALRIARARGADDALLVGHGGEVLEGATSNLFVVTGGALRTPPLSTGILPGVTRALVLRAAAALGLPARERLVFASDVYGADEVLLSSSVRELVPVTRADDVAIGAGRPGPVAKALHAAYRRLVAEAVADARR